MILVDRGILTPRKTRFYSRPNKLKHKPFPIKGSLSTARAFSSPIRFPYTYSSQIFYTGDWKRQEQGCGVHASGLSMPMPFREMPMSSNLSCVPCFFSTLCVSFSFLLSYRNLFFSRLSIYNSKRKYLTAFIHIAIRIDIKILLYLGYNFFLS